MTPEEVRDFYYAEYNRLSKAHCGEWSKPLVQNELSIKAFGTLAEKIRSDCAEELAKKYLETSYKFT